MRRASDSEFYRAVAGLLGAWVAADAAVPLAWLSSRWLRVYATAPHKSGGNQELR